MIFTVILIFSYVISAAGDSAGSALFTNHGKTDCWSQDEIAKLKCRKIFENAILPAVYPANINGKYITSSLRYYRKALQLVDKNTDHHTGVILKESLADAIGAHLRSEILPSVKFAYYAGYINYRQARKLHDFYDEIKNLLNTQGVGWRKPANLPKWVNLTVLKIVPGFGKLSNPCETLILKRDSNSCIHLPLPKLDDEHSPSAIALPFKSNGLVSLTSPSSENIMLKYYTTVSRCLLRSSPKKCRHSDFVNLNNELWNWLKKGVAPHLVDENLYSAYGGVLRIAAAVQNYGKAHSTYRRNLFDNKDLDTTWHPWKTLTESYVCVDSDDGTKFYVILVVIAAFGLCILQICYNYLFGENDNCHRVAETKHYCCCSRMSYDEENNSSSGPFKGKQLNTLFYKEKVMNSLKRSSTKTKSSSHGSIKTQKVYDLNENTEKVMDVIMSENEVSETESQSESVSKNASEASENEIALKIRTKSPPKLQTSITQLTIKRTPRVENRINIPVYSTSNTCKERDDSNSSSSLGESITSAQSISTVSSRSGKSKKSRDLAWARRVISRHSLSDKKSSGTEFDGCSITPTSPRL